MSSFSCSCVNDEPCRERCEIFNCTREDLIRSGFYSYSEENFKNLVCCGFGWRSENVLLSIDHLNALHCIENPDCIMVQHHLSKIRSEQLSAMEETFRRFPKPYHAVEDLVKSGFYFTGLDDAVKCVACGVILEEWRPQDIPQQEHRIASPNCLYVHK